MVVAAPSGSVEAHPRREDLRAFRHASSCTTASAPSHREAPGGMQSLRGRPRDHSHFTQGILMLPLCKLLFKQSVMWQASDRLPGVLCAGYLPATSSSCMRAHGTRGPSLTPLTQCLSLTWSWPTPMWWTTTRMYMHMRASASNLWSERAVGCHEELATSSQRQHQGYQRVLGSVWRSVNWTNFVQLFRGFCRWVSYTGSRQSAQCLAALNAITDRSSGS